MGVACLYGLGSECGLWVCHLCVSGVSVCGAQELRSLCVSGCLVACEWLARYVCILICALFQFVCVLCQWRCVCDVSVYLGVLCQFAYVWGCLCQSLCVPCPMCVNFLYVCVCVFVPSVCL